MGTACSSCFKGETTAIIQPDMVNEQHTWSAEKKQKCYQQCYQLQAARRRIQEEAAERRRQENENRGIKDPEKVRRQQQRAAQIEKDELEAAKLGAGNPSLKVNRVFGILCIIFFFWPNTNLIFWRYFIFSGKRIECIDTWTKYIFIYVPYIYILNLMTLIKMWKV